MCTGMMVGAIYCNGYQGPDHQQLTLLNWDTKSVLALNKKLKVNWKCHFFYLEPKHFQCPNRVKSIADDPALSAKTLSV